MTTTAASPVSAAVDPVYEQRLRWFHEARFGMFIHYGLYSLGGRGEWLMFRERIAPAEYARLADQFKPRKDAAEIWAAAAARAGAKYAVLTTRHHDGFCLFDSNASDFKISRYRHGRDLVREFAEACRRHGLRVGFYYSLLDWRFPGYFEPHRHPESAKSLVQQVHDQVRELLSGYGEVDMLWYDGGWISHGRIKDIQPAEFWRAHELNAMARQLQPNIIINNRSGEEADLDTPEQHVTASRPGRGWESCMTIGDAAGWGYLTHSPNMKTIPQLLQNLCIAASGEGNFLLNVGPKPNGSIRREETQRLEAMGDWLKVNGEAIYGSQRCALISDRTPGAQHGYWTRKGNTAYLCVFRWPGSQLILPLIKTRARSATVLATGRPAQVHQEYNGRLVLSGMPDKAPSPFINVIRIEFDAVPEMYEETDKAAWLTGDAGKDER